MPRRSAARLVETTAGRLFAENLDVLKLNSLSHSVEARGEVYDRDPGVGTHVQSFEVDPAIDGQYVLALDGMIRRVDSDFDLDDAPDVSISASGGGSSASLANFDQAPLNDEDEALCGGGSNPEFLQVNVFARVHHYTAQARALGVFEPFPRRDGFTIVLVPEFCNAMNLHG